MLDHGPDLSLQGPLAMAVLCGILLVSLSGCVEMIVGGAIMGTVVVADRRTVGAQTEDKAITIKGELGIPEVLAESGHVNIASFNRHVLLTGEVPDAATKAAVEREVSRIEGAQAVVNELEIARPSTFTARSNDALITIKVKASLVNMRTISAASFKVVTERGIVYLMGLVTRREGGIAADVARNVGGVEVVVKIFEYITEEELQKMTGKVIVQQTVVNVHNV